MLICCKSGPSGKFQEKILLVIVASSLMCMLQAELLTVLQCSRKDLAEIYLTQNNFGEELIELLTSSSRCELHCASVTVCWCLCSYSVSPSYFFFLLGGL